MRAAVLQQDRSFKIMETPTPQPKEGQILVKVICCGICGSDVHIRKLDRTPIGVTPGHEWLGVIEELGQGVTNLKIGDRVVMHGYPGGGGIGPEMLAAFLNDPLSVFIHHPVVTAGGFGEYLIWSADKVHVVPEHVTNDQAVLVDTFAVGAGAVEFSKMKPGDSVLIVGAGPIGLAVLQCARAAGASKIYVSEPVESRRKMALDMGAAEVFDPAGGDVRIPVLMKSGGGPDIVFDCVGSPRTIQQSVDMAKMGGTAVIVGLTFDKVEINPVVWLSKSIHVCATMQGNSTKALELIANGSLETDKFITGRVSLDDIQKGFEMAEDGNNQIKVVVYAE